jgi:predicted RNA-binding protein with TRAM domain
MVNDRGEHIVETGDYTLFVGGAQPGDTTSGVSTQLEITGQAELPR